jgi:hypothetical protein
MLFNLPMRKNLTARILQFIRPSASRERGFCHAIVTFAPFARNADATLCRRFKTNSTP